MAIGRCESVVEGQAQMRKARDDGDVEVDRQTVVYYRKHATCVTKTDRQGRCYGSK
jgi:hypothetical protein